jgi:TonB-linked SusC/RagA family outer membrane protein
MKKFTSQTHHNLSFSGGSDRINYYMSADYFYQDGLYRHNGLDFRQYQVRSNLDATLHKNLTVGFDLSLRQENRHSTFESQAGVWRSILQSFPYLPAYHPNGLLASTNFGNIIITTSSKGGFNDGINRTINSKISFNLDLDRLVSGLSLSGYGSFDFNAMNGKRFRNTYVVYAFDPVSQQYVPSKVDAQQRELTQSILNSNAETVLLSLHYKKRFHAKHLLTAFLAHEINLTQHEVITASRKDFVSDQIINLNAGGENLQKNSGSTEKTARLNYFGQLSYDYNGRYLADLVLRRDGSQNFSKENRFGWFSGVSVGWMVSEESFLADASKWMNHLKLRASWSRLGNDKIPPFQYVNKYQLDEGYFFGREAQSYPGFSLSGVANPDITWEVATQLNLGLDVGMVNHGLTIEMDYFYAWRDKILIKRNASIPDYTGLVLPDENLGQVSKKGFELLLDHRKTIGNVEIAIGGNFTFARNQVEYWDESPFERVYQRKTGHPMDSWLIYKTAGLYQSQQEIDNSPHLLNTLPGDIKYIDVDMDGKITTRDMIRVYRSATPEIMYGIKAEFQYKGIQINIFLQGQSRASQIFLPNGLSLPVDYYNGRWTLDNPNARYPRAFDSNDTFNSRHSTYWLRDVSFLRIKNIQLAYNLPSAFVEKLHAHALRIYLTGSNLWIVDRAGAIYDPESVSLAGAYYPQQRIINMGVTLTF